MTKVKYSQEDTTRRQGMFLQALKQSGGIIAAACENSSVKYSEYKRWMRDDALFAEQVEEVSEAQFAFVESKLMQLISANDTTSIIFYLKTKGKGHGYTQRSDAKTDIEKEAAHEKRLEAMKERVELAKVTIREALEAKGAYSSMLDIRIETAAMLYTQAKMLFEEMASRGSVVNVETTREGDRRESLSPLYVAYLRCTKQLNDSMSGLGIEVKPDTTIENDDTLSKFLESIDGDDGRGAG